MSKFRSQKLPRQFRQTATPHRFSGAALPARWREEIKKAFDQRLITDYSDLRYHNEHYLKAVGNPTRKDEMDSLVMAAFSVHPHDQSKVATAD
jgi:hypothetical protein